VSIVAILAWPAFAHVSVAGMHAHGYCYLWDPRLVTLHVASDVLIGLSYVAISLTLAYLVQRSRAHIPFSWMFLAFGAFIIACGATHFMEVWTLWWPSFWFAGNVKVVTAIASVTTAIALPPLVPRVLALVESASVSEQRRADLDLAQRELTALEALRQSEDERARLLVREHDARTQAEEANRLKDEFFASVSHELRTPLNAILGWSRMLSAGTLDAAGVTRAIETVERNATLQAKLIEDLLDVSRIITGRLRLDVRPVELRPVIEAAIDAVRPAADAKSISLSRVLDPLPAAISGDPDRLQQVVWNLLSNAIKFTPTHGQVQVRLQRVNSHIEIVVTDTGSGIRPDFLPHVFDRFAQGDRSTEGRKQGLGLGLGIVRHLTELHGGTVSAESGGEGQGATFTVRLPLVAVKGLARESDRHPSAGGAAVVTGDPSMLAGITVLVIEDDPDARTLLQTVIERHGGRAQVADSAQAAYQLLDRTLPHVIVSDVEMPVENGYTFIRNLRARQAVHGGRIPTVAVTAYARVQDRLDALTAGFDMHVPKPVEPAELVTVIAALVRRAAARSSDA
jgi:signal transduction histidine kinase/CheY-like chemotaxis protein